MLTVRQYGKYIDNAVEHNKNIHKSIKQQVSENTLI